eukprot:1983032-Alexandrium_andersonii.AAC.1
MDRPAAGFRLRGQRPRGSRRWTCEVRAWERLAPAAAGRPSAASPGIATAPAVAAREPGPLAPRR